MRLLPVLLIALPILPQTSAAAELTWDNDLVMKICRQRQEEIITGLDAKLAAHQREAKLADNQPAKNQAWRMIRETQEALTLMRRADPRFLLVLDEPRQLRKEQGGFLRRGMKGDYFPVTIRQIIDSRNALVEIDEESFWLKGFGLGDLVDGKKIILTEAIYVSGTRQYTTILGASRTVLVLEPLTEEMLRKKLRPPERDPQGHISGKPAAPTEGMKPEEQAQVKLTLAKRLLELGNTQDARADLEKIVAKYPNTKAAAEAQALLAKLRR